MNALSKLVNDGLNSYIDLANTILEGYSATDALAAALQHTFKPHFQRKIMGIRFDRLELNYEKRPYNQNRFRDRKPNSGYKSRGSWRSRDYSKFHNSASSGNRRKYSSLKNKLGVEVIDNRFPSAISLFNMDSVSGADKH